MRGGCVFIMDYTDKVVIVTGSSSGIGAAAAKAFSKHGAFVTIVGRNEERLLEVAKICTEFHAKKPLCMILDLTKKDSCEEVVRRTVDTYGKIDVVVNSAGKLALTSVFDNCMENFDELIALNLRIPYKMTQLCTPHLKKTKGVIINVFGAPLRGIPGFLTQSMIRDALERFTKSAAAELASEGIRMNAVRPGITRTNLLTNLNVSPDCLNETYHRLAQHIPNNVIIEPDEVAKLILFAAGNTCPNLNAANLILDGAASWTFC